jgi:plasmid stability protein
MRTMTLQVPEVLYTRLKERAAQTNRSVEAEVLDVLAGAVPGTEELPADLEAAISALAVLDDTALWEAARSRLPADTATTMEQLHFKRQCDGLTQAERTGLAAQIQDYERQMLVRAQAAALLHKRGHDVSSLTVPS